MDSPDETAGSGLDVVPAPALLLRSLSKSFAGTRVLKSVDLDVAAGEIHALVGENGSGKSTTIKILAGYHQPDGGASAEVGGTVLTLGSSRSSLEVGCRFVHQDLGLVDEMSVLDNLTLGTRSGYPTKMSTIMSARARSDAQKALDLIELHVGLNTPIWKLPIAQRTGVAIARALRDDPEHVKLLVLDEPTASLPVDEVERLHEVVRSAAALGIGVLYVTHRLEEVFALTQRTTVLRDGEKVATTQTSSLTRQELVDQLVGKDFPLVHDVVEQAFTDAEGTEPAPAQPAVLTAVSIDAGTVRDVSFELRPGEILGFAGITGSGRESVLPAIFGGIGRRGGTVSLDGLRLPSANPAATIRAGLGYLPPDRKLQAGFMGMTGAENLTFGDLRSFGTRLRLAHRREMAEAQRWFTKLDVRPAQRALRAPLSVLSGGNQQKVVLGRWLRREPKVLLLDEPTQGVDIGAKGLIHAQVAEAAAAGAAVAVSSTDVDELVDLCHRVLVIAGGEIRAEIQGAQLTSNALVAAILGSDEHKEGPVSA